MWSASALKAHCAHPNVLGKTRTPSPRSQAAMDKGTLFHSAVELWARTGRVPDVMDLEVQGWLELLASQWQPRAAGHYEIAWGLSPDLNHVMVAEPRPHVYEAMDGSPLLTAGRADLAWLDSIHMPPHDRPWMLTNADWKTGAYPVAPARENLQALAGCIALADRFHAACYRPAIYYARDGVWDWGDPVTVGSDQDAANREAVKTAALLDGSPQPGPWCGGCWERKQCPSAEQAA